MFHEYPYTDNHEMNLDWVIKQIKQIHDDWDDFKVVNSIKFFGEWQITEQYPIWALVNDNNTGYISKKIVPAGVPISNTDYWGVIVDYSTFIADLQNRVVALENTVSTIEPEINEIYPGAYRALNRRYIFISDSYGETRDGTSWIAETVAALGLDADEYYKRAGSGYGFKPAYPGGENSTFINLLTAESWGITDKASITDIIVGGGFNDQEQTVPNLNTAIAAFMAFAKTTFPNAHVWIAGFGWSFNSEYVEKLKNGRYLEAYKNCGAYGATYITGSDWIMHRSNFFFEEDGALQLGHQYVHPNEAGSKAIGSCIAGALSGSGTCSIHGDRQYAGTQLETGITLSYGAMNFNMYQDDNTVSLNIGLALFTIPSTTFNYANNNSEIKLFKLLSGFIASGTSSVTAKYTANGFIQSGGQNVNCPILIQIKNNAVYVSPMVDNVTTTVVGIYRQAFTIPVTDC